MSGDSTIDQEADRLAMCYLTAQEIANHLHLPIELIVRAAGEFATRDGRPVDDVLRDWVEAVLH